MAQLLGLCRFSYPSEVSAFGHDYPNLDALRTYLYSPERLAMRLFVFEHFVLPSVQSQTDLDFKLLVLAGDEMPDDAKARLTALCDRAPQIVLMLLPEGQVHRDVCSDVMRGHRDHDTDIVAEFRLDDDDALARNFIETARRHLDQHASLFHENESLCIDYCRGHLIVFDQDGVRGQPVIERMWTPAQIICRKPAAKQSLLNTNHMQLWRNMPTISWQKHPMFIRGVHGDNDSDLINRNAYKDKWIPLTGDYAEQIGKRFGVDAGVLGERWAAADLGTC